MSAQQGRNDPRHTPEGPRDEKSGKKSSSTRSSPYILPAYISQAEKRPSQKSGIQNRKTLTKRDQAKQHAIRSSCHTTMYHAHIMFHAHRGAPNTHRINDMHHRTPERTSQTPNRKNRTSQTPNRKNRTSQTPNRKNRTPAQHTPNRKKRTPDRSQHAQRSQGDTQRTPARSSKQNELFGPPEKQRTKTMSLKIVNIMIIPPSACLTLSPLKPHTRVIPSSRQRPQPHRRAPKQQRSSGHTCQPLTTQYPEHRNCQLYQTRQWTPP